MTSHYSYSNDTQIVPNLTRQESEIKVKQESSTDQRSACIRETRSMAPWSITIKPARPPSDPSPSPLPPPPHPQHRWDSLVACLILRQTDTICVCPQPIYHPQHLNQELSISSPCGAVQSVSVQVWVSTQFKPEYLHSSSLSIFTVQVWVSTQFKSEYFHSSSLSIYTVQAWVFSQFKSEHLHSSSLSIFTVQVWVSK